MYSLTPFVYTSQMNVTHVGMFLTFLVGIGLILLLMKDHTNKWIFNKGSRHCSGYMAATIIIWISIISVSITLLLRAPWLEQPEVKQHTVKATLTSVEPQLDVGVNILYTTEDNQSVVFLVKYGTAFKSEAMLYVKD